MQSAPEAGTCDLLLFCSIFEKNKKNPLHSHLCSCSRSLSPLRSNSASSESPLHSLNPAGQPTLLRFTSASTWPRPGIRRRSKPISIQDNISSVHAGRFCASSLCLSIVTEQESTSAQHVTVIAQQLIWKILLKASLGSLICVLWILFLFSVRRSHSLRLYRSAALTQSLRLYLLL